MKKAAISKQKSFLIELIDIESFFYCLCSNISFVMMLLITINATLTVEIAAVRILVNTVKNVYVMKIKKKSLLVISDKCSIKLKLCRLIPSSDVYLQRIFLPNLLRRAPLFSNT